MSTYLAGLLSTDAGCLKLWVMMIKWRKVRERTRWDIQLTSLYRMHDTLPFLAIQHVPVLCIVPILPEDQQLAALQWPSQLDCNTRGAWGVSKSLENVNFDPNSCSNQNDLLFPFALYWG